jgi:cyclopropane-fatty-acyl-phospholipid synthase
MERDEPTLEPEFLMIQKHYDLSNEFFSLFLDPSMTYSCAKFDSPQISLADAQIAKLELSLNKCELKPGQRLLDIGCGWGGLALRAHTHRHVNVVGLTLSNNQHQYCQSLARDQSGLEFRLQGWETFDEKVDRIVSIGAFEHFGDARHAAFFERCRAILPADGVMLLHTITMGKRTASFAFGRFAHFISVKIFPGSYRPPAPERVIEFARNGGFEPVHVESLRPHYARTLDCWAENLKANRSRAVAIAGEEITQNYIKYLTDCSVFFRGGECNIHQFKFRVS